MHARTVDSSGDIRAEIFGKIILERTPVDAIIFAEGDQAVFALWYFHFALGERPDIVIFRDCLKSQFVANLRSKSRVIAI